MTKAQLEEELKKSKELIKQQGDLIVQLQQQNSDILSEKGVVMKGDYDGIVTQLINKDKTVKGLYDVIESKNKRIEELNEYVKECDSIATKRANQIEELTNKIIDKEKEIESLKELKVNNEQTKIKNERNAGRKKSANVELIQKLRAEGKTQEQVARELNISLSTVRRNEK